ncbi:MAG: 2-hydroxyacid dehydrogenase [Proteobacteria bacterium]|nr:2-hydroxyacid dehydrogenase [Pseudomonadota bacterium]
MLGVMLDRDTLAPADLDLGRLQRSLPQWSTFDNTAVESRVERLQGATVAVANKVPLDATVLDQAPLLRLICVAATGVNNIDLEAARRRGIAVCNVAGYSSDSVAQHVFTLLLALRSRLLAYDRDVRAGAWQRSSLFCRLDHPLEELAGQTLGIVGLGAIGSRVQRIATAFGMRVLIAARPGRPAARAGRLPLFELLPQVDALTLHCPLTPQTEGMIGPRELASMRPNALLINTARGSLVDEAALASALRRGTLGGAGVDVLSEEPPRGGNPLLDPSIPQLIVTPHVAWGTRQARQRLVDEVAQNIEAFRAGCVRNRVA